MISVKSLKKTYASGTKAVNNLSLEVGGGEILALLGPNGAGKSSTIRVLTTLSGFDEGEVTVAGFNVDTHAQNVRATIGYVAQETGVDFFLTGRENLTLQGHLYKMPKPQIEARIDELAKYFGIYDVLDDLVSSYSGGMRRKLDIATALMHKPQMIFLDEPTLGLDTQSRQNLWQYIHKLNKELGLTILLTTHYLEEADKLANRVAIIDKGQIKTIGKPEDLKDQIQGDVVSLQFDEQIDKDKVTQKLTQNSFVKDNKWEQNKLHLYVSNGASCIPQLIEECNEIDIHVKNVSFARPSLDDVFIKITGASLESKEDGEEEKWWEKWAGKGGGGAWGKKWQSQNSETDDNTNEDWQAEASKWSEDEQKQWWDEQNKSPESENDQWQEARETNEKNGTDWQQESAKWSEEEQQKWWSQKNESTELQEDPEAKSQGRPPNNESEHWPEKPWTDDSANWQKKNQSK